MAGYDAYAILQTGRDQHGVFLPVTFKTFNDWASPFLNYYLVPFIALLGLNAFSLRSAVAFLSLLSLVLFYFFAVEYFKDKFKAVLAFFLMSFSSFAISTARWTIPTHTIILPFLLFLLFLAKALDQEKNRSRNLILAQIFLGFSVYTDTAMKLFALFLQIPFVLILKNFFLRKKSLLFLAWLVFFGITLLTYFDHLLNLQALNNRFNMISIFSLSPFWPLTYLQNYFSYLLPFGLFLGGEVNPVRAIPDFGYEHLTYGIFFYAGLFSLLKKLIIKEISNKEKFILTYYFISPLATSFTLPAADWHRTLYALPAIILISAEGFSFLIKILGVWLSQKLSYPKAFAEKSLTAFFVILVFINLAIFSVNYFGKGYSDINKYYFQYGLNQVYSYLLKNENQYQAINVSNVINMPYIYYLFYSQYDPRKLKYEDFKQIDKKGWIKITKIGKYNFREIKPEEIKNAKLLKEIPNSPVSKYQIWKGNQEIFVVIKINSTSEVEHGYTSGYL